jgi:hypothetical protein
MNVLEFPVKSIARVLFAPFAKYFSVLLSPVVIDAKSRFAPMNEKFAALLSPICDSAKTTLSDVISLGVWEDPMVLLDPVCTSVVEPDVLIWFT